MKVNLAVYTAQEGYSWQPGTVFTAEELAGFKKAIGRFPSPDSMDFPFGGIFLLEDRVVFYRYHVAKKIDFRGRDALYCVLGAVSREEAAKIDPAALFSCPEFAGPMMPFPVSAEVPDADPSAVPEWLKNLNKMTLDVRIAGAADKPSYAVVQNPVEVPKPDETQPTVNPGDSQSAGDSGRVARPARPKIQRWIFLGAASAALIAVLFAVVLVLFSLKGCRKSQESNEPSGPETSKSNTVQVASLANAV